MSCYCCSQKKQEKTIHNATDREHRMEFSYWKFNELKQELKEPKNAERDSYKILNLFKLFPSRFCIITGRTKLGTKRAY